MAVVATAASESAGAITPINSDIASYEPGGSLNCTGDCTVGYDLDVPGECNVALLGFAELSRNGLANGHEAGI